MKIRILFVGFKDIPKSSSDDFCKKWTFAKIGETTYSWANSISIFDFNVILLNNIAYIPKDLSRNLTSYLIDGGIICIFVDQRNAHLIFSYIWSDTQGEGTAMVPNKQDHWLWKIIAKPDHNFRWSAVLAGGRSLPYDDIPLFEKIALTPNKKCISAIAQFQEGKIIALPSPYNESNILLRELIDGIKENILRPSKSIIEQPPWIDELIVNIPGAEKKRDSMIQTQNALQKVREEYEKLIEAVKILYLSGTDLSFEVCKVFDRMGFTTRLKESHGRQDIEINHHSFSGVVEVKGLNKHATVDDVRQLLDWWIEESKRNPNVKGIFVVNHYKSKSFELREKPYTLHAIQVGVNNKFCLMTTVDLFGMYCDFLSAKKSMDSIVETLDKTTGLLTKE
jgi:hypothetical protein